MKRLDLPLLTDSLFYTAASWFFLLGILRYFHLPTAICLAVSTLIALAIGAAVFAIISFRHKKRLLGKRERERREALMLHLALEKNERVRLAILNAYSADGAEAHLEGDALNVNDTLHIPLFTMQPVTADAVAVLLRDYGEIPFTLVCNALTPEAEKLLSSFGRRAVGGDEVYALFERTGTMPEKLICGEIPRKTARAKLVRAFSKKNARPFFVSGLLLLFMSLFTLFPLYYLVTGSVLLATAVFVRALGYA